MRNFLLVSLLFATCSSVRSEGVGDFEEERKWLEEHKGQPKLTTINDLTQEDRELLVWARAYKAKENRRKEIGYEKFRREETWLEFGEKQYNAYRQKIVELHDPDTLPRRWDEITKAEQAAWAHLSKLACADVIGLSVTEKLTGMVEGDYFVISGRYHEVQRFTQAVEYLRYPHLDHGNYSHVLNFTSLVDTLQKQSKAQESGDKTSRKTMKACWQIKGKTFFDADAITLVISEAIDIWPGEIAVLESDGIKAKKSCVASK